MNTKNNQRTRLSIMLLKNAMMDLLEEKRSADRISVRELCEKAELNRSTFYAHYGEPADLLCEIEDDLIGSVMDHLGRIGGSPDTANARAQILSFLRFIKEHDRELRILLAESADNSFKNKFMDIAAGGIGGFDLALPAGEEQYVYSYILNGSTGVIVQWIRSGYSVDENRLVELLFRMNKDLLKGVVVG